MLTQISAYLTHKNLAICKIMDAMCTAYAKCRTQSEHISNWVEANDHGRHASIVKGKHALFVNSILFSWNCLMNLVVKVLLKCVIHFFISFPWYAFPNFCTQISRPLAYSAHISSKAGGTAGTCNIHIQLGQPICIKINQNLNLDESKSKFKYFVDSVNEGFWNLQ